MHIFDHKTFNGEAFGSYIETLPRLKRNELLKSGALVNSSKIKNLLSSQTGSFYGTIPMHGRIGGDAVNYDGVTDIDTSTLETFHYSVIAIGRAKGWTEKDFSQDITAGEDFMDVVGKQVVEYWDDVNTDLLLSILKGIFSMTGAKNLEFVNDHTHDISEHATDNVATATTLNTAIQKACGDNKQKFSLILMHSQVATNLENLKLLSYLKYTDADGIERDLALATLNGKAVLIDDSLPTEEVAETSEGAGDGYTKYTSYVLGNCSIEYADLGVANAYEMDRNPSKFGGETALYTRERIAFAPYGFSFTKSSVATNSPTNVELEKGSNWSLVNNGQSGSSLKTIDHKAIPIARIITRG